MSYHHPPHCHRRAGVYHFRFAIPAALRPLLGGLSEVRRSLGTPYLHEARDRATRLAATVRTFLGAITTMPTTTPAALTPEQRRSLLKDYLRKSLDEWERDRATTGHMDTRSVQAHADYLKVREELATTCLVHNALPVAGPIVDELLQERGWSMDKGSPEYALLCRDVLRVTREVVRVEQNRHQGDYDEELADLLTEPMNAVPAPQAPPQEPATKLTEVIASIVEDKRRDGEWTPKTEKESLAIYNLFLEWAGESVTVDRVDYPLLREYRAVLRKLPRNRSKTPKYRGKSVHQLLTMKVDTPFNESSVKKHLNRLSSLFDYAMKMGYMSINPAAKMQGAPSKRPDEYRSVFTTDDLRKLFCSPKYMEDKHRRSFQYWTPIIALFTGMRQNEIAQLHLEDIRQVDGVWVFDINDRGDKKLKRRTSAKRLIPLHPFLLAEGLNLPGYAQRLRSRKATRLFPELEQDPDGGYASAVTRWFNGNSGRSKGYKRECGVRPDADGGKKDFHSFRHTLIDHLKQKQVDTLLLHELDGHSAKSMTLGRYGKKYHPRILLEQVIMRVDFHQALGLDHLKRSRFAGPQN